MKALPINFNRRDKELTVWCPATNLKSNVNACIKCNHIVKLAVGTVICNRLSVTRGGAKDGSQVTAWQT